MILIKLNNSVCWKCNRVALFEDSSEAQRFTLVLNFCDVNDLYCKEGMY